MKSKKFLLSLLLLGAGLTNAMATTRTIFSMTVNDGASVTTGTTLTSGDSATISGGFVTLTTAEISKGTIVLSKNKYITISLTDGETLKVGDVITLSSALVQTDLASNVCIYNSTSRPKEGNVTTNSYTITDGDVLKGLSSFYVIGSSSTAAKVKTISITRSLRDESDKITTITSLAVGSCTQGSESVTSSSGATVYALTEEGYKGRIACENGAASFNKGIVMGKNKTFAILNCKKGDVISITGIPSNNFFVLSKNCIAVEGNAEVDSCTYKMTADGSFDFKSSAGSKRLATVTIAQAITINAGTGGYKSYSSTKNILVTDADVYYILSDPTNNKVILTKITNSIISANEGVILKAANTGDAITISLTTVTAPELTGNKLIPTSVDANATVNGTTDATYTYYALNAGAATFGKITADITLGSNKAYIKVAKTSEAKDLSIEFSEATGINNIGDGFTADDDKFYNLNGIRVNKNYKGIVVKNGKKFFVK